ncbi:MAG: hypothetical protein ACXVCH_17315 [Bdellovibrionota bacterium]
MKLKRKFVLLVALAALSVVVMSLHSCGTTAATFAFPNITM